MTFRATKKKNSTKKTAHSLFVCFSFAFDEPASRSALCVTIYSLYTVTASTTMAQTTLANSMVASTTTARYHRVSPPPPPATLSRQHRGSKAQPLFTRGASTGRHGNLDTTERRAHLESDATVLHATASDSIEIAATDEDDALQTSTSSPSSSVPADLVEVATFGAPHGVRGEVRIFLVTDEPEERLLEGVERGSRFWVAPQVENRGGRSQQGGILLGRRGSSSAPASSSAALRPRLARIEASRPAPISRSSKKGSSSSSGSISWLLKLRGIDSPEAAAALANTSLWMSAAERPALPESGEDFYAQELIGMEARLAEQGGGKLVGVVVDVCGGGGTDLLRLELSDDEEEEEDEVEEELVEEEVEGDEAAAAAVAAQRRRRQRRKAPLPPPPTSSARRTVLLPFTRAFVPHVDRQLRRMTICPPDGLLDLAILPPKAQLQQEREAALAEASSAATSEGETGTGGEKKQSRPRRPRGRRARDRAGGGTAAPPSA